MLKNEEGAGGRRFLGWHGSGSHRLESRYWSSEFLLGRLWEESPSRLKGAVVRIQFLWMWGKSPHFTAGGQLGLP